MSPGRRQPELVQLSGRISLPRGGTLLHAAPRWKKTVRSGGSSQKHWRCSLGGSRAARSEGQLAKSGLHGRRQLRRSAVFCSEVGQSWNIPCSPVMGVIGKDAKDAKDAKAASRRIEVFEEVPLYRTKWQSWSVRYLVCTFFWTWPWTGWTCRCGETRLERDREFWRSVSQVIASPTNFPFYCGMFSGALKLVQPQVGP